MAYDPVWQGYLSLQRSEAAADGPGRGLSNYRVQVWFVEIPKQEAWWGYCWYPRIVLDLKSVPLLLEIHSSALYGPEHEWLCYVTALNT